MGLTLRSTDLEWRRIDDDIVVLDGRESTYLALNRSAALLWASLASGASREELAGILVQTYGLESQQAVEDTDAFVSTLVERGLLAA